MAWVSALFAAALLIGVLALVFVQRPTGDDVQTAGIGGVLSVGLGVLAFAIVGALIVTRRPRHPIGWIYTASGLLIGLALFSVEYSRLARQLLLPFAPVGDAVFGVTFFAGFLLPITFGLLLFPDGHLPSRAWRTVVLLTVIGYLGIVGVNALAERPEYEALHTAAGFGALAVPVAILASVASLILRWRRAVGVERQQLKWVGAAALLLGLDLVAVLLLSSFGAIPTSGGITFALLATGISLVPLAAGVAILRYRLYDIDVLINRTLVYGALSAALAATYFVAVLTFETVLRPVTAGSELSVALSTLAVVALFTPLRARLQQFVDRRFYRSRYDAERTVDAFSVRIRDEVAPRRAAGRSADRRRRHDAAGAREPVAARGAMNRAVAAAVALVSVGFVVFDALFLDFFGLFIIIPAALLPAWDRSARSWWPASRAIQVGWLLALAGNSWSSCSPAPRTAGRRWCATRVRCRTARSGRCSAPPCSRRPSAASC